MKGCFFYMWYILHLLVLRYEGLFFLHMASLSLLCDPPERLGLPVRFWVTGRELRLFKCAENMLGVVRLGRY